MRILCAAAAAILATGCSVPTVNLSTAEPIKVDIAMRLDVYQHSKETAAAKTGVTAIPASEPETRRRNRMADIQNFKNSRLIGENRDGLVTVRVDTPGEEGDYVRKTVSAENEDRMALMKTAAERDKKSLPALQAEQASLWQKRSFEGELIEVSKPDGTFEWTEKSGR
ncbi:MAG: DUF1318 domain-containing protein [Terrimicrobiaceae bacterium]